MPTSVGGNSWGLAQGERSLGIDATVLNERHGLYGYPCDICLNLQEKNKLVDLMTRMITFFQVRNRYDVFHFNFGSTLLDFISYGINLWDLPFYPRGKKIVFTFNGCDVRQKDRTIRRVEFSACHDNQCYGGLCNSGVLDERRRKRIKTISRYAAHIFAVNPDLLHFLPSRASFLPYSIADWDSIKAVDYTIDDKIRIVHSPTNRSAKGSDHILPALDCLAKKYSNIEIITVENLPREEALKIYSTAHLVVDQVLVGWYGAFGVEAMKMGKPLAVFIREEDLKFIPEGMASDLRQSIINIHPGNIEAVLDVYLQNTSLLREKSMAGLEYVHKWHDPAYVAGLTKQVYEESD